MLHLAAWSCLSAPPTASQLLSSSFSPASHRILRHWTPRPDGFDSSAPDSYSTSARPAFSSARSWLRPSTCHSRCGLVARPRYRNSRSTHLEGWYQSHTSSLTAGGACVSCHRCHTSRKTRTTDARNHHGLTHRPRHWYQVWAGSGRPRLPDVGHPQRHILHRIIDLRCLGNSFLQSLRLGFLLHQLPRSLVKTPVELS